MADLSSQEQVRLSLATAFIAAQGAEAKAVANQIAEAVLVVADAVLDKPITKANDAA